MLRIQPISDAKQAESYYSKSDAGYYMGDGDLRREWMGRGAELLKLHGTPDFEQFRRLIHGLDPHSGSQLTAKLIEGRLPGWDINVHCSKGVTLAIEQGDDRIQAALWEATREAIADLEGYAATRVRKGGKQEDRVTGNLVGYAVEHAETRPVKEDNMPQPHRHIHVVVFNLTRDSIEGEWKAVKVRPIMDERKWFDRRFNQRFAAKVAALGYDIETKWERDGKGGRRYIGWDIKGIPDSVIAKFSRRTKEIEQLAEALGVTDAIAKDKLGATSRLNKRKDLTLDDCRRYWESHITPEEAAQIDAMIGRAMSGQNPKPGSRAESAMAYAVDHHFTRQAVCSLKDLEITAMERSMGSDLPQDVQHTQARQKLLIRDGEATTPEILACERRVIEFARDGMGTCRPLGNQSREAKCGGLQLSPEQEAVVRHIWESSDRCILLRGAAGTGKTTMAKAAVAGIDRPVVMLAPSADASRGTLRAEGFKDAETVAAFLDKPELQQQAKDGVIFIDEVGLLPLKQLRDVFDHAETLNARLILQGDPKQHQSVNYGSIFSVLERHAGLPVAELKEIRRQSGDYKRAVAAVDRGDLAGGLDLLDGLGWVHQQGPFDGERPLVDAYMQALDDRKSVLVVAATHQEKNRVSQGIRLRLKERSMINVEDRIFPALRPLGWTEAQRGDLGAYAGTEVVQFHRNSGMSKAGQRASVSELDGSSLRPEHFAVYAPGEIALSAGDTIRITANGRDVSGKHKVNNGATYSVAGFVPAGVKLTNGWVLPKDFCHWDYGYCQTSFAAQGRTVDRVLLSLGHESAPAINAANFYVGVSRGRERCAVFTDMALPVLRQAIQRTDERKSATELVEPARLPLPRWKQRMHSLMKDVQRTYRHLRDKARGMVGAFGVEREAEYAR